MRLSTVAAACAGPALFSLAAGVVHAQSNHQIHLIQPVSGAIVRETVPFRLSPGDLPRGGYVSVTIDGKFRTARVVPANPHAPVYLWNTKADGADTAADGDHTIQLSLYNSQSHEIGSTTVKVRVANEIKAPSQDLKLVYHWASQRRLIYHRVSDMTVPGTQAGQVSSNGLGGTPPDQALQSAQLTFLRTTEDPTAAKSLVRDLIVSGVLDDHGQTQPIRSVYNIAPLRRTVNSIGVVLSSEETDDFADHIGFPLPELPVRRVGKGDRWQSDVQIPLTWDGSSVAHVTAECSLQGFEWQNNYPTAKILEQFSGPAHFIPHGPTASGHTAPYLASSAVTFNRTVYFAYGAGRLIKSVTHAQITLTSAQLNELGAAVPGGLGGSPYGGPGGPPYGGLGGPPYGGPGGYPGPGSVPGDPGYPGPGDVPGDPGFNPGEPGMAPDPGAPQFRRGRFQGYPGPGGPPYGGPPYGGPGGYQGQRTTALPTATLDVNNTTTLETP